MMHTIPTANTKDLRIFGLLTGAIAIVLFGFLFPWIWQHPFPRWPWLVAAPLWSCALLVPSALRPIYQIWMRIGLVLGWINTRIILGLVFFLMLTPMAWIMALLKHDPMSRRSESSQKTYRIASEIKPRSRMEKPF